MPKAHLDQRNSGNYQKHRSFALHQKIDNRVFEIFQFKIIPFSRTQLIKATDLAHTTTFLGKAPSTLRSQRWQLSPQYYLI